MARRGGRRPVVPGARPALDALKAEVMRREGWAVNPARPDDVKYEIARSIGVPLQPGTGGELRTDQAGRIGGRIGGPMVREMIRMAQERLAGKT